MQVEREIALWLLRKHPNEAAGTLHALETNRAAQLLAEVDDPEPLLLAVGPTRAAELLGALAPADAASILKRATRPLLVHLLRRLESDHRRAILERLPAPLAASAGSQLAYAPGTAGAIMDVDPITLSDHLDTTAALELVRKRHQATPDYACVIDAELRLLGLLHLTELVLVKRAKPLRKLRLLQIPAVAPEATLEAVLAHPGWASAHALPVIDSNQAVAGLITYSSLRGLQQQLGEMDTSPATVTTSALADLFWTGLAGLAGAMSPAALGSDRAR